jgi:hypothetical protein
VAGAAHRRLPYLVLGINRVRRRTKTLRGSVANQLADAALSPRERVEHLSQLERPGQRITARAVWCGNAIGILHIGDEAYPDMLAAIEAARRSVGFSTYLIRAKARGVSVPRIDAQRRLIARWSCSTMLLRWRRSRTTTAAIMGEQVPVAQPIRAVPADAQFNGHGGKAATAVIRVASDGSGHWETPVKEGRMQGLAPNAPEPNWRRERDSNLLMMYRER